MCVSSTLSIRDRCYEMVETMKRRRLKSLVSMPDSVTSDPSMFIERKRGKGILDELDSLKAARVRTYQSWPHSNPSEESMISAGWFYCKIQDRVFCLYCEQICHGWTCNDDPVEVHRRLSPQCAYVLSMASSQLTSPQISHEVDKSYQPRHPSMRESSRRHGTFENPNWTITSPSAESLARAGFFYQGIGNAVTCFYCSGALEKWGATDDPRVEHARWFPHCQYAKDLCGNYLHAQIQVKQNQHTKKSQIDKETLLRLVNARLDLPISQELRKKYPIAVVKRCIEDQLNLGKDDFQADIDFQLACHVLQRQIDIIRGQANLVVIPSRGQQKLKSTEISEKAFDDCVVCLTETRQIACMPCGHLCTCVSCGYSLQNCPMCRQKIQSLVRISVSADERSRPATSTN